MPQPTGFTPAASGGGTQAAPARELVLPACLDLNYAEILHEQLLDRASQGGALSISGADVERVSTSCMQLLVAAAISARSNGVPWLVSDASDVLNNAVRDLGLGGALGMEKE